MVIRTRLSGDRHATITSAYAPTMTYSDEEKERLYENLKTIIRKTARHDKLILLGDFNARVRSDLIAWERFIGHRVVENENSNGFLLLTMCAEFQLVITNTLFQQAEKYKSSWMHARSKHWHLIDYIINRQRDIHDVRKTRAMRCTDCWSDHRMIRRQMCLNVQPSRHRYSAKPRKKLGVSKLKSATVQQQLMETLNNTEPAPDAGAEWARLRDPVYGTNHELLCVTQRKQRLVRQK